MSFQKPVTQKEFAREVFVGVTALACLFAIFVFVALQKSTGRSLSPLAYLWPETFAETDERIPVVVFRDEQDRQQALAERGPSYTSGTAESNDPVDRSERGKPRSTAPPQRQLAADIPPDFQPPNATASSRSFSPVEPQAKPPVDPAKRFPVAQSSFEPPAGNDRLVASPAANKFSVSPEAQPDPEPNRTFPIEDKQVPFSPAAEQPPTRSAAGDTSSQSPEERAGPASQANFLKEPSLREAASAAQSALPPEPIAPSTMPVQGVRRDEAEDGKTNEPAAGRTGKLTELIEKLREVSRKVHPRPDDSAWKIAEREYGDGKYFRHLAQFNGLDASTDQLPDPVLVPPLNRLLELYGKDPAAIPAAEVRDRSFPAYRTRGGETMFEIARDQLGAAGRFVEIIRLNQQRLPADCQAQTVLEPGILLQLPSK